jgi:subtilisin-like proprotein convertase family protein
VELQWCWLQEMETWKGIRGDGVRSSFEGKRGRRQDSSTVSKTDNTMKNDTAAREAEGGNWCLEVEDDQRKLGR